MNNLKIISVFVICLNWTNFSAANRYWIAASGGNWETASNWSSTSGGVTDNLLPTQFDDVYIDYNSNNGIITTSSIITISSLQFTNNSLDITLKIISDTLTIKNDLTLATFSTIETMIVDGGNLVVLGNSFIYGGIFTAISGTVAVKGTIGMTIGFDDSPAKVNCKGATINIGNSADGSLTMLHGAGVLTISSGIISIKNHFESTAGDSLILSGGTINIGTGTAITGSSLATMFQCNGTSILTGGIVDIKKVPLNGLGTALSVFNSTTFATGGLIKITATNASYKISPKKAFNLEIDSPGVTATLINSSSINGNVTLTNGTLQLNGFILTIANILTVNNGILQASSGTINVNGSGIVLAINGGTANFNGATINIGNGTDEALRLYTGFLNISGGIINVKNYLIADVGSNFTVYGGTINIGTGGSVTNLKTSSLG